MPSRPNILLILTDQLRYPPEYETEEIRRFRREELVGETSLRADGVEFERHYTMSTACAPSRTSLLTGHYPSWHGVTQTDGLAKSADGDEMTWLEPDTVPTLGDWFRAGGYRTFYKGKWHVSHAVLEAEDGSGELQSIDGRSTPIDEHVARYLEAELLDEYGFSEWVGPEPHGLGRENTGTIRDPFTADETIELLERFDKEPEGEDRQPWLTVCSFLNPHDIALFGVVALAQGLRYDNASVPSIPKPPTADEDLSTKPACHASYNEVWGRMFAPQPFIETHRKFYYQMQRESDAQMRRVLDALRASRDHEDTIIVFSSDHGDLLGAHDGMHQKWHNAYDETIRVPFIVAGERVPGGSRSVSTPTSHADLLPTLLGLAGIEHDATLAQVARTHRAAHPLVGRDLSPVILDPDAGHPSHPVLFTTDDEISEGSDTPGSPFQRVSRAIRRYDTVVQPNHVQTVIAELDIDGELHVVKYSRYHDDPSFWTEPGVRDERLERKGRRVEVTTPSDDEYELYDLTVDPNEARNLAHASHADDTSRDLAARMHELLLAELARKRLTPDDAAVPGYRPPAATSA